MKYKVGDKVRLKSKEGLDELKRQVGDLYIHPDAYKNAGSEQTILECSDEGFYCYDDSSMFWHESLFEGLVEDTDERLLESAAEACKKVDEMMEARYQKEKTYYDGEQWSTEFECPDGYIFKDENGNVINATKIVLEKKKKEYPKTYEECCKVMNYCCNPIAVKTTHKEELIRKFQFLLMYRDAYWKIAGEEMGLGKPWKPDYTEKTVKYCLRTNYCRIVQTRTSHDNHPFSFPTEEMRDAFYENFKELIESCKELL